MDSRGPPLDFSLTPHLLPPPRSRTGRSDASLAPPPSMSGRSRTPAPFTLPPLGGSTSIVSGFPYDRSGALSVPPLGSTSSRQSNSSTTTASADSSSTRVISCLPCKRAHLKCGRGTRPCGQCIKRNRVQDCMEGVPPEQAQAFLKAYNDREKSLPDAISPLRSHPPTPVFDDALLFPPSAPSLQRSSTGYPSLGQTGQALAYPPLGQLDSSIAQPPIMLILGQDLRIGKVSPASLRMLGYHPHEMVNHTMAYYLPILERDKWSTFTSKLFTSFTPAGRPLPVSAAELAKISMNDLLAPVDNMRSIAGHYHMRHHNREHVSVRIELYFGSYFGATSTDFNTFDKAIIIAKVTQPSSSSSALPPLARLGGRPAFPSVLMPVPPEDDTGNSLSPPHSLRRAPSFQGGTGLAPLPPLPRLPSLSDALGGELPPLPSDLDFTSSSKLPSCGSTEPLSLLPGGMITRKRRPSSSEPQDLASLTLPPLLPFSGSTLARPSSTRPRLGSATQQAQSFMDSESQNQSSSFDFSPSFGGGLPPLSRPPSRSRRPSYF
ncbi:hypothetical protein P389DRAFT_194270 [Cystobasidium minutum MCA 4210]|uniref:uncharacterized protein n=1 Tax=Cystobasidium minutum MCA 4210 TaxID=1397322 RepID=UPI0034CD1B60|eukprot:jgi/Rhomi1/194270/gm1.2484_g